MFKIGYYFIKYVENPPPRPIFSFHFTSIMIHLQRFYFKVKQNLAAHWVYDFNLMRVVKG